MLRLVGGKDYEASRRQPQAVIHLDGSNRLAQVSAQRERARRLIMAHKVGERTVGEVLNRMVRFHTGELPSALFYQELASLNATLLSVGVFASTTEEEGFPPVVGTLVEPRKALRAIAELAQLDIQLEGLPLY